MQWKINRNQHPNQVNFGLLFMRLSLGRFAVSLINLNRLQSALKARRRDFRSNLFIVFHCDFIQIYTGIIPREGFYLPFPLIYNDSRGFLQGKQKKMTQMKFNFSEGKKLRIFLLTIDKCFEFYRIYFLQRDVNLLFFLFLFIANLNVEFR